MAMIYGDEVNPNHHLDDSDKATMPLLVKGFVYDGCEILEAAESSEFLTEILQLPEAAYLLQYYTLVTQIRSHIRIDDKLQFASFLRANRELVHNYPAIDVLRMLCWRSAAGCAAALLEDPHLCVDLDVNHKFSCGRTPLFFAAGRLSYATTSLLLLLHHGADPNIKLKLLANLHFGTLFMKSGAKIWLIGPPRSKSFLELFHSFCMPDLKRPFDCWLHTLKMWRIDLCFKLMYFGEYMRYVPLLIGAWDKLMVSSSIEGGLETTPVWQHISRSSVKQCITSAGQRYRMA